LQKIGKYRIIKELGAGGMGTVYEAVHESLDRTVALKVIKDTFAGKDSHLNRFKREADVCANLKHKNIIELYDYGEENGILFYAMELIDADTLDDYAEKLGGRVPVAKALKIGEQLCEALSYLHERGLIHRDLKPANIMINSKGHVTLMDFGLVKALEKTQLTQEGKAIGTPRYMSPEMLRASGVTKSSDIFQLGIILYEIVTGTTPFTGTDIYVLARNILSTDPKPAGQIVKGVSPYFDALITNCLEKETSVRYKTADEVRNDINRIRKGFPVALRREAELSTLIGNNENDNTADSSPDSPLSPSENQTNHISRSGSRTLKSGAHSPAGSLTISGQSGTMAESMSSIRGKSYLSSMIDYKILFKDTFKGRFPVLIAIFAILASVSIYFLTIKHSEPYTSTNLKMTPDIGAVRVSWEGNQGYLSKGTVWKVGDSDKNGSVFEASMTENNNIAHNLLVSGLESGQNYFFRIEFPDGTSSLPYKMPPINFDSLQIESTKTTWISLSELKVSWQSNVKAASFITYKRKNEERQEHLSKDESLIHTLHIHNFGDNEEISDLKLTLKSKASENTISLPAIGGSSSAICDLLVSITSFASEENINEIAHKVSDLARNESKDAARAYIMEKLNAGNIFNLLQTDKPLFKPIFSSKETSMRSIKIPLYTHLRRLGHLDSLLTIRECKPIFLIDDLYRPLFNLSHSDSEPEGENITLASFSEDDSSFYPATNGQGLENDITESLINYYNINRKIQTRKRHTVTQDLSAFLENCSENPRIVLRVRNMPEEFFMRVLINGTYPLELYNTASTAKPVVMWGIREHDLPEDGTEYNKFVNFISLSFPKDILVKGPNTFTFELHQIPGSQVTHTIQLRAAKLYR
jgi:serine/threonine protein kinase